MNAGLRGLIERAWRHHRRFRDNGWFVTPSAPVLYFGDRHAYESSPQKVITVGLNPSHLEFPADEPFRRFPGADSGNSGQYAGSLDGYFRAEPYTKWFNPAFEALLNGLDCSYYDGRPNIALHTDLCSPLATNPTWSRLGPKVRSKLQAEGVELWHDLVRMLRPDVIIVSVARKYMDLIQYPITQSWRTIYTVQRKNPYEVRVSRVAIDGQKRALVVFGRAANLPFGTISGPTKRKIGALIKHSHFNGRDKLCFVQFLHPGGEHRPDHGDTKEWNRGPHKRKFMLVPGRCVRSAESYEGALLLWGEWEAQSEVVEQINEPLPGGPRFIYRPYYSAPGSYRGLQNTDPFVFDRFFYTGCQQHTKMGATQLRYLKVGSVIMFGSCIDERDFAIDTVFVIDDWIEHDRTTWRRNVLPYVPTVYRDVTLAAWYQPRDECRASPGQSFRLYRGATYDNPLAGTFSFFPCIPHSAGSCGFERPVIRIPGVITGSCKQGKRLNEQPSPSAVAKLWRKVVEQVESQGCWLGVHAEAPPRT